MKYNKLFNDFIALFPDDKMWFDNEYWLKEPVKENSQGNEKGTS